MPRQPSSGTSCTAQPEDDPATRDLRIRLGEIINAAIDGKRIADTRQLGDVVAPYCVASNVREPSHELDAVHVALLVDTGRVADLERELDELAGKLGGPGRVAAARADGGV